MKNKNLTWIEVDLRRAAENYDCIRKYVDEECKLCIVVKNDAYGLGIETACLYDRLGADQFATVDSREALALRRRISEKDILVLGFVFPEDVEELIRQRITLTIYDLAQARSIHDQAQALGIPAKVHIKIDTGLHRLGFLPDEAGNCAIREVLAMAMLEVDGIYTHFAKAEDPNPIYTHKQIEVFRSVLDPLKAEGYTFRLVHASSTRAMVDFPEYNFDMVRPGLIMSGFHYFGDGRKDCPQVKPSVGIKSTLVQIKEIPEGAGVGYGYSFIAQRPTIIGVLPLGYAQGYAKAYANKAYVLCNGHRCPIVGNIAMNHCMVDLTEAGKVAAGMTVTVFGSEGALTIADGAALRGTNIEEVLVGFAGKLPVQYVGGKEANED